MIPILQMFDVGCIQTTFRYIVFSLFLCMGRSDLQGRLILLFDFDILLMCETSFIRRTLLFYDAMARSICRGRFEFRRAVVVMAAKR